MGNESCTLMLFSVAVVCCVLNLLSFWVSANLGSSQRQLEKLAAFECGLEPLGDSRMKFEILFFSIALLYLIFDLEIVLLFPLALSCTSLFSLFSPLAFSALLLFLILLRESTHMMGYTISITLSPQSELLGDASFYWNDFNGDAI
jgi:NADH:ubiquinone oxidoreductase subunit 3 (subunit A)